MKVRDTRSSFRFFGERTENYQTKGATVAVKAIPDSWPDQATWLPATDLKLTRRFSQDVKTYQLGEPVTMSIDISIDGNRPEAIPDLKLEALADGVDGLKFYPEKPQLKPANKDAGKPLSGTRTESAVVIVNKAQTVEIPGFRIAWWDLKSDSLKFAEVSSAELIAAPGPGMSGPMGSTTATSSLPGSSAAGPTGKIGQANVPALPGETATPLTPSTPQWLWWLLATLVLLLCGLVTFVVFLFDKLQRLKYLEAELGGHQASLNAAEIRPAENIGQLKTRLNWYYSQFVQHKDPTKLRDYTQTLLQHLTASSDRTLYSLADVEDLLQFSASMNENVRASLAKLESQAFEQYLPKEAHESFNEEDHKRVFAMLEEMRAKKNSSLAARLYA